MLYYVLQALHSLCSRTRLPRSLHRFWNHMVFVCECIRITIKIHAPGLSLRTIEPEFLRSGSQQFKNLIIFLGDSVTQDWEPLPSVVSSCYRWCAICNPICCQRKWSSCNVTRKGLSYGSHGRMSDLNFHGIKPLGFQCHMSLQPAMRRVPSYLHQG